MTAARVAADRRERGVAAGVEVHPVEIADLLLGFFLIDVGKDDW